MKSIQSITLEKIVVILSILSGFFLFLISYSINQKVKKYIHSSADNKQTSWVWNSFTTKPRNLEILIIVLAIAAFVNTLLVGLYLTLNFAPDRTLEMVIVHIIAFISTPYFIHYDFNSYRSLATENSSTRSSTNSCAS